MIGAAGIPAGAVLDTKEIADEPTFHERGILQIMDHPTVKNYVVPAWPVRHNGKPVAVKASPLLGEHTGQVLESWLGLGPRDIEALEKDKVVTRQR